MKSVKLSRWSCLSASLVIAQLASAQVKAVSSPEVPIATQWTLDAAGATQRNSIKSVFLLVCPRTEKKGTSFLLSDGLVVSNEHVVEGCAANDLEALKPTGETVRFKGLVVDEERDLALLLPAERIVGGLELGNDSGLPIGTVVTTWGFPLIYNGPAPILSVGYVAGFNSVQTGSRAVKHIVVNGAFNPGNSGGPVFLSEKNSVVGVVVWKKTLLSPNVGVVISALRHSPVASGNSLSQRMPDGNVRTISNEEGTALVLEEFARTVQVMIGEAISVSELKAFITEKERALRENPH
jgi:S1-C subfamily serine protease